MADVGDDDAVAVSEMGWEGVVVQRASRCCQSASCLQVCYALRWCSLGNDVVLWLCVIAYAQHGTVGLAALEFVVGVVGEPLVDDVVDEGEVCRRLYAEASAVTYPFQEDV